VLCSVIIEPEAVAVRKLLSDELIAEARAEATVLAVLPCPQETEDVVPLIVAVIVPASYVVLPSDPPVSVEEESAAEKSVDNK
jgi:hypothetical protein